MQYAPYSHYKLSVYAECHLKFALQYIAKCLAYVDSPVFERGNYFHWRLRHYPLNPEFGFKYATRKEVKEFDRQFEEMIQQPLFQALMKHKVAAEYEFFFDENFKPLKSKENAMMLGTIDYVGKDDEGTMHIIDYKTGKSEGDPFQLEIYAVWAMIANPKVQKIKASFVYLDEKHYTTVTFTRDDLESLKEKIINTINTIEADPDFEANVTERCAKCSGYRICESQMKE